MHFLGAQQTNFIFRGDEGNAVIIMLSSEYSSMPAKNMTEWKCSVEQVEKDASKSPQLANK